MKLDADDTNFIEQNSPKLHRETQGTNNNFTHSPYSRNASHFT
ncbi:hypothetical protein Enr17x_32990 [Gimesia fumaroli]|uniref:Uncharacterized protein n=1 Tax=Gimesia fumaroli TaxID=2527976 RepID=A0A518IDV6_9PLAN|nr:hypothetical protein Enr17x_32990 [Gimesia fumaroli]